MKQFTRFSIICLAATVLLSRGADALGQTSKARVIREGVAMGTEPNENAPVIGNLLLGSLLFPLSVVDDGVKAWLKENEMETASGCVKSERLEMEEEVIQQPSGSHEVAGREARGWERMNISVGATYGRAWSVTTNAVGEFEDTKFKNDRAKSVNIMVKFPSAFALELRVGQYDMVLSELDSEFGTLKQTPVELLFKLQRFPQTSLGIGAHADIGIGVNLTNFQKGPFIRDLELLTGAIYRIETNKSVFGDIGVGLDIFLGRFMSIILEGRLYMGNVNSTWIVTGLGGTDSENYKFYVSNAQALVGLRFWI